MEVILGILFFLICAAIIYFMAKKDIIHRRLPQNGLPWKMVRLDYKGVVIFYTCLFSLGSFISGILFIFSLPSIIKDGMNYSYSTFLGIFIICSYFLISSIIAIHRKEWESFNGA